MTAIHEKLKNDLLCYAQAHRTEFFEDIKAMSRIDSTQGPASEGLPYGEGPDQALRAMVRLYEKNGAVSEIHSDRGYALVRFFPENADKGYIGGFTHCDVVLPNGEWLYTTPYEPVERNGYLIGRGVKDDKGGGVLLLYALKALHACGYRFRHAYQGFFGANEETGFGCIRNFLEDGQLLPAAGLSPDASFTTVPGENSKFSLFVKSRRTFENILDFDHGGSKGTVCGYMKVVMNYSDVLWKEVTAAQEGRTDASVKRSGEQIVLETKGKAVHIAAPHYGIHAGGVATEILLQCPSLGESDLKLLAVLDEIFHLMKCELYGCEFNDELFGPTSTGMLSVQLIDGYIGMEGRLNYSPLQDTESLMEAVRKYYRDHDFDCELKDQSDGYRHQGKEAETVDALNAVFTDLNSGRFDKRKAFGATYSRFIPNCYSTGLEVPFTTRPDDFPEGHGMIHQPDECVDMDSFVKGIAAAALHLVILDETF